MPHFFQFSKNGRASGKPKEKYARPTKSTMNRICAVFDDIGNINLNFAGVPPFNYQMLMSEQFYKKNMDIVQTFCNLDSMSLSTEIALAEIPPHERSSSGMYEILADIIKETLIERYGSVDYCYPYLVKALFAGDNWKKSSHKKMFWRVFGETAVQNIEKNLENCTVCPACGMKIPRWADSHTCPKNNTQGFVVCEDCGKLCPRIGSRQIRCEECQKNYRDEKKRISSYESRLREKERLKIKAQENISRTNGQGYEKKCSTSSQLPSTVTSEMELSGPPMFFVNLGQPVIKDLDGK